MKIYLTKLKQLLTQERSLGKKQKKIYSISNAQWNAIQRLSKHKYPIQQINDILELQIKVEHLSSNDWIDQCKGNLAIDIAKYVVVFPLYQAIDVAKQNRDIKNNFYQNLVKKSTYPIFLIILSFVLLSVFSKMILPQMLTMIDGASSSFQTVIGVVQLVMTLLLLAVISFAIITVYVYLKHKRKKFDTRHLLKLKIISEYASYELIAIMQYLLIYNVGTYQLINYLKSITKETLLEDIVDDLDSLMNKGHSFDDAIHLSSLSKNAKTYLLLGLKSNDMKFFLSSYFIKQLDDWDVLIKKYSMRLQLIAYGMVGTIVFIVYQIMLMPLDMLQNF